MNALFRTGLRSSRLTTATTPITTNAIRTMSATTSTTPMEDTIREKLTTSLTPTTLLIRNDSHLHAHHTAMRGSTSRETHFHVTITSPSFVSKMQPARHRMVYALLKEEMSAEGGIHALQLRTRTPEEEERQAQQSQAQT